MRLYRVRLLGRYDLDLPIVDATPNDPFIVTNIDGLGPVGMDTVFAESALGGGTFQGRTPTDRQAVFTIILNEDYAQANLTVQDLRNQIYGLINPERSLAYGLPTDGAVIQLLDDPGSVWATTVGYVAAVEVSHFSQNPAVQVTMNCPNPYLDGIQINPETDLMDKTDWLIDLPSGVAPTGIHMELEFTADMAQWMLTKNVSGQHFKVVAPFETGDILTIDTRPGYRECIITRDGVSYDSIGNVSADSEWLMLGADINTFTASSPNFDWNALWVIPQYWGV